MKPKKPLRAGHLTTAIQNQETATLQKLKKAEGRR